nr:DNA-3-methyladenine glycosylase [Parvibaculum sp.]
MLAYLGGRAIPGVEQVTAARYARSFRVDGVSGVLSVAPAPKGHALEARIEIAGAEKGTGLPMRRIAARLRRLFDLDAEPSAIVAAFEGDLLIGPRITRAKGLRVPGTFDGFELAIRAVLGQQISVKGATTIAGRIVERFGERFDSGVDGITHFFPAPQRLARGDYAGLGLTGGRIATLKGLAAAVTSGALDFGPRETLEAKIAELTALPGIGEWTAHYVALRALGEPDAFPASDLGLRKAAGGGAPVTTKELELLSQDWRPWRGYAALALWTL